MLSFIPNVVNYDSLPHIPVNRIKKATGVLIHIPSDDQRSDEIRIEGSPEGVQQAKEELLEMAHRMVSNLDFSDE